MYKIIHIKKAFYDLEEITEHLSQFYEGTVARFNKELNKIYDILERNPYLFGVYIPNPQYHRCVVGNYLVFYKIFENPNIVEIHRVLHSAKNIKL